MSGASGNFSQPDAWLTRWKQDSARNAILLWGPVSLHDPNSKVGGWWPTQRLGIKFGHGWVITWCCEALNLESHQNTQAPETKFSEKMAWNIPGGLPYDRYKNGVIITPISMAENQWILCGVISPGPVTPLTTGFFGPCFKCEGPKIGGYTKWSFFLEHPGQKRWSTKKKSWYSRWAPDPAISAFFSPPWN